MSLDDLLKKMHSFARHQIILPTAALTIALSAPASADLFGRVGFSHKSFRFDKASDVFHYNRPLHSYATILVGIGRSYDNDWRVSCDVTPTTHYEMEYKNGGGLVNYYPIQAEYSQQHQEFSGGVYFSVGRQLGDLISVDIGIGTHHGLSRTRLGHISHVAINFGEVTLGAAYESANLGEKIFITVGYAWN